MSYISPLPWKKNMYTNAKFLKHVYYMPKLFVLSKVKYSIPRPGVLSGASTAAVRGVNYQLLAVYCWSSPMGSFQSCQPQPATDMGVIHGRYNWLTFTHHHLQDSFTERHCNMQMRDTNQECCKRDRSSDLCKTRPPYCLCCHSIRPIRYMLPFKVYSNRFNTNNSENNCLLFGYKWQICDNIKIFFS